MSEYRASGSRKRSAMKAMLEEQSWDCSVCTYTNSPEAFKCLICDVRKGTSTRKPKLNQLIVAQQEATRLVAQSPFQHNNLPAAPLKLDAKTSSSDDSPDDQTPPPSTKLSAVGGDDRSESRPPAKTPRRCKAASLPSSIEVTVNNVTVVFTEIKSSRK